MKDPKYSVGQVLIYKGRKEIPVIVREVTTEGGEHFYRIDRKNCLHEPMLRELNDTERGASPTLASTPQELERLKRMAAAEDEAGCVNVGTPKDSGERKIESVVLALVKSRLSGLRHQACLDELPELAEELTGIIGIIDAASTWQDVPAPEQGGA